MANTVDKVIKIAEAEVGYLEKSASAYKKNAKIINEKTKGAGNDNYTKYGKEMHEIYPSVMDFPAAWCDCFVDWCFYKAYGINTAKSLLCGNFDDYTIASANMYKNKNAWYSKGPKKGDQIFFKNSNGTICHTGLVYDFDDARVYTIEGNTNAGNTLISNGGGVAKKSYPLYYDRIAGYGRPNYDTEISNKKSKYKGEFPSINNRKGYLEKFDKGLDVAKLQKFLNWYGNFKLAEDGDFGVKTDSAVRVFQQKEKLTIDGQFGSKSLEKAKKIKK